MVLVTFASRLSDAGLLTHFEAPEDDCVYIGRPWQPVPGDQVSELEAEFFGRYVGVFRWDLPDRVLWFADPARVYWYKSRWSFCALGCPTIGGYNLEVVQCFRDSLEEMYELVWSYYFREPVLIEGWKVPLYQRPNWKRQDVERAIASARVITSAEAETVFFGLRTKLRSRPDREVRGHTHDGGVLEILPTMDDLLYYTIEDKSQPNRELHIRFDCKEAFVQENRKKGVRPNGT